MTDQQLHRSGSDAVLAARDSERLLRYPLAVLLLLFFVLLIRTAWVGDDAFIPHRTMDNFVNGYGLRWNISERVQVFTDPLWFFLITIFYFFTREAFITTIVLSMAVSTAAVLVVARQLASSAAAAIAGVAALISSKAFMDYTTSGLENALNYLLLALFCLVLLNRDYGLKQLRLLVLLGSLSAFNRLDTILLFAPAIAWVGWTLWKQGIAVWQLLRAGFLYSVPLWAWLVFSTIYFGFVFPNTYYAKIYTGVPKSELLVQGLLYYANSLNYDPVTLITIGLAVVAVVRAKDPRTIACVVGMSLYLLYIISFGGDFMTGRFFTVPFFFAVALLVRRGLPTPVWLMLAVLFLGVGLLSKRPAILSDETYPADVAWDGSDRPGVRAIGDHRGIADERAAYFQGAGLLPVLRHDRFEPTLEWAAEGREARRKGRHISFFATPGFFGYYAGPEVHIVDTYALGDPLLSKLPIIDRQNWRIGHYRRGVPVGYLETVQSGQNRLKDPQIRDLYRVIKILTRDPVWNTSRFIEIAKMNLGFYNKAIRSIDVSGSLPPPETGSEFPWPLPDGRLEPGAYVFPEVVAGWGKELGPHGAFWWANKDARLTFSLPKAVERQAIDVPIQTIGRDVRLEFLLNGERVAAEPVPGSPGDAFTKMRITAPMKRGKNVLEIVGSGEAVRASDADARQLLFAVGEPRWP